ncbi:MAG: hypothetical protein PGN26_01320 [Xylophilus ampelinus]
MTYAMQTAASVSLSVASSAALRTLAIVGSHLSPATGALLLAIGLAGCGGGGGGSSDSGSGSKSSSSAGADCSYKDQVSADERSRANACGIQVSGAYGAADARLQQIIQACQAGQKAAADADYANAYTKLVQYARDNSSALSCGSGSNSAVIATPSAKTYYNFCGKTSGSSRSGSCWGPVSRDDGGCGNVSGYTYIGQYGSQSACISARDSWLAGR